MMTWPSYSWFYFTRLINTSPDQRLLAKDVFKNAFFLFFRFLLTRYAESLGQFAAASQSCNFSLRFFHSNQKDVSPFHLVITFLTYSTLWKLLCYLTVHSFNFSLLPSFHLSFSSHQTSEYIIQAYKYGAFEKIPEFIALRNRLNHSLHFAQVRTERMLLDLFLEADMWGKYSKTHKIIAACAQSSVLN